MILQALTGLFEDLVQQGKLSKPGWSPAKISYALCLDSTGALTYVALYMLKAYIFGMFVNGLGLDGTLVKMGTKLPGSLINALFASVAGPGLFFALKPALDHAGLLEKM